MLQGGRESLNSKRGISQSSDFKELFWDMFQVSVENLIIRIYLIRTQFIQEI